MSPEALSELISSIAHNLVAAGQAGALTDELIPPVDKLAVMRPKDRAHGDWASNIAMQLAKKAGMKPRDLAEPFAAALAEADGIAKVEVAGPGFINITLDSASAAAVVDTVLAAGAVTDADKHLNKVNEYGRNDHLGGQTLNLEFVSANPTGPIHIGGTRWAAVGDAMARVLEANGAREPAISPSLSKDIPFIISHIPSPGETTIFIVSFTALAAISIASGHFANSSRLSLILYIPSGNSIGAFRSMSPTVLNQFATPSARSLTSGNT